MAVRRSGLSFGTVALLAVSLLLLALAGLFAAGGHQMEADNALARRSRPAVVPIERFDPAGPKNPSDEVIVLGQIDMADMMSLQKKKLVTGTVTEHWDVAAIYPATATDKTSPAPGVLIRKGDISDDQLRAMTTGQGAIGPILTIDGKLNSDLEAEGRAKKALAGRVQLVANPVLIDPYKNRREVEFAPDDAHVGSTMVTVTALLGCALLALAIFRTISARRRWRKQQSQASLP